MLFPASCDRTAFRGAIRRWSSQHSPDWRTDDRRSGSSVVVSLATLHIMLCSPHNITYAPPPPSSKDYIWNWQGLVHFVPSLPWQFWAKRWNLYWISCLHFVSVSLSDLKMTTPCTCNYLGTSLLSLRLWIPILTHAVYVHLLPKAQCVNLIVPHGWESADQCYYY